MPRAVANLQRYEAAVEEAQGEHHPDIHAALKGAVWEARAVLRLVRSAAERERLAAVSADDIQQARRRAQEQAIAAIARARGWLWQEAEQRWRTPEGAYYSAIGEPFGE